MNVLSHDTPAQDCLIDDKFQGLFLLKLKQQRIVLNSIEQYEIYLQNFLEITQICYISTFILIYQN